MENLTPNNTAQSVKNPAAVNSNATGNGISVDRQTTPVSTSTSPANNNVSFSYLLKFWHKIDIKFLKKIFFNRILEKLI